MSKNKIVILIISSTLAIGIVSGYLILPSQDLCEGYPHFCAPCGSEALPSCPQVDEGWLCCSETSGICSVANGSCGKGYIFGHCKNYTENSDGTAVCHDKKD